MGRGTDRVRIGNGFRRVATVLGLVALTACTPTTRYHGYTPSDEALAAVQVGGDTRETVLEKVGPPSAAGVLDRSGYYYVKSEFRHFGFLAPEEVRREVLAIAFGVDGRVSNVERFDLADGRVVPLSRRVTEDSVESGTFLRQLAGAAGNFDAGALIDQE